MQTGTIWKFGHNIDTDQIIASQYLLLPTIEQMKIHAFESIAPDFTEAFNAGDIVLGGENFGCGSSREQAPRVLKALGVNLLVAKSYARIFFRNAINIGLPLIVCREIHNRVETGDSISYAMDRGEIILNEKVYHFEKFPEHIVNIIKAGGLINYINHSR